MSRIGKRIEKLERQAKALGSAPVIHFRTVYEAKDGTPASASELAVILYGNGKSETVQSAPGESAEAFTAGVERRGQHLSPDPNRNTLDQEHDQ